MKALTLWRPWPRLIFEYGKDIENRSWAPPESLVGQRIAIHAGNKIHGHGVSRLMSTLSRGKPTFGADVQALCGPPQVIVGTVLVVGWLYWNGTGEGNYGHQNTLKDVEKYILSEWLEGPCGWMLADPWLLPHPVSCRGHQKLWNVPGNIEQEIQDQLMRARGFNFESHRFIICPAGKTGQMILEKEDK